MAIESEHAVEILLKIFKNEIGSDLITLIAGVGGQRIPINRVVLTANSEYFTASLGPNFREAGETEFILDGVDGPTLKAVVDFCYTGRIDLTEENASKYLAIASGVELRLLEQKCFRFFADKVNMNNAVTTLVIADKYNGHVPRQRAFDIVCELFDKIPPPQIDELDRRLLKEILESDAVHAQEQYIFERVLCWYRKDHGEREQYMTDFLKLIRLPLIPPQYLNSDTMQMVYKEFGILEYLNAECKQRIACPTPNAGIRNRLSIHCLSKHYYDDKGSQQSGVKIERYINAVNGFEGIGEVELGLCKSFEALLHENKVYILGGEIDGVAQKSVSVIDLISGKERVLPGMTTARSSFAAILVRKFIYVFGGRDGRTKLPSCERFDLESETWETLKPMSLARSHAAVATINGQICVAGGFDLLLNNLNNVELYNPQNDGWITLSPLQDVRGIFAMCNSKGNLYAMGGQSRIERYDSLTNRWSKIKSLQSYKYITTSVVVNDSIYVIGIDDVFVEMKIEENVGCSFTPLAKPKLSTDHLRRIFLFCDY